MINFDFD